MGWLARITGRSTTHVEPKQDSEPAARYRGVQVIADSDDCCQAVRDIAGRRFLAEEVPPLPLEGCDTASCQCTYKLFGDRRTDLRRTSDIGYDITSELRTSENRRLEADDRRKNGR